jgi:hypothetical protein
MYPLAAVMVLLAGCSSAQESSGVAIEGNDDVATRGLSLPGSPSSPIAPTATTSLDFSQPYLQRTATERLFTTITITNVGCAPHTVSLKGGVRIHYAGAATAPVGTDYPFTTAALIGGATAAGATISLPAKATAQFVAGGGIAGGGGDVYGHIETDGPAQDLRASGVMSQVEDSISPQVPMTATNFPISTGASNTIFAAPLAFTQPYASRCVADRMLAALTVRNTASTDMTIRLSGGAQVFATMDGGCGQHLSSLHLTPNQIFGYGLVSGATSLSAGVYKIPAGTTAFFLSGGGAAGGTGQVFGTVEAVDGSSEDLAIGGIVSYVEDSATYAPLAFAAFPVQVATKGALTALPGDPGLPTIH